MATIGAAVRSVPENAIGLVAGQVEAASTSPFTNSAIVGTVDDVASHGENAIVIQGPARETRPNASWLGDEGCDVSRMGIQGPHVKRKAAGKAELLRPRTG